MPAPRAIPKSLGFPLPPPGSAVAQGMNWIDDNLVSKAESAYEDYEKVKSPMMEAIEGLEDPAKDALHAMSDSNDGALHAIADNISTWAEKSEALWKTLDGVAQIHPFIGIAVVAFRTAVEFELQRRDNDRKIGALRVQRMEMMSVLCDLKDVADKDAVANNTRLADLIKTTASDIQACTYTCDKYIQKKLVVRVLKSHSWASKLASFGKRFESRKSEFEFALSIYTGKGISQANEMIGDVKDTVDATQNKIDMLLLFRMLESPAERALMHQVEAHGGASKVMASDTLLKDVLDAFPSAMSTVTTSSSSSSRTHTGSLDDQNATAMLQGLKKELNENIDAMLRKDRLVFEAKFDVQMKQLTALKGQVTRESDRVITTLLAGPGDRIRDKVIHKMWKDMGWKSSARTSRFVLVLRDYYLEKYADKAAMTSPGVEPEDKGYVDMITTALPPDDKWTLSYIGFTRLQPINEAFDEDASGFVTVQEINRFTGSRPEGWSLPHWIAFWAVGWHLSLNHYSERLNGEILPAMLKLARTVLPSNRGRVDRYLCSWSFRDMNAIITSVAPCPDSDQLLERFQAYIDNEEKRLEDNLKPLKYEIDALNTLTLVTGPGRFEQFIFPLLYLVLSHHYRLVELCTREIVSDEEFIAAASTLSVIWAGACERIQTMKAVYEQDHIDPKVQFERTAHGMFNNLVSPERFETKEMVAGYPSATIEAAAVSGKLEVSDLEYPVTPDDSDELEGDVYRSFAENSQGREIESSGPTNSALLPFVGWWDGIEFADCNDSEHDQGSDHPTGRVTLRLQLEPGADGHLSGSGSDQHKPFTIRPLRRAGKDGSVTLRLGFWGDEEAIELNGKLSDHDGSVKFTGKWKSVGSVGHHGRFIFEQRSLAAIQRARPHPRLFEINRGKALWSVARIAVLQHLWSWRYFKDRREARKRFVELRQQERLSDQWSDILYVPKLSDGDLSALRDLKVELSVVDQHFYRSLAQRSIHRRVLHHQFLCHWCSKDLGGVRYACTTCVGETWLTTFDLCADHWDAAIDKPDGTRHDVSHPMFKARGIIHYRDWRRQLNNATNRVTSFFASERAHVCDVCQKNTTAPCYVCMDHTCASNDVFICENCEHVANVSEWKGSSPAHRPHHLLLRIPAPVDGENFAKEKKLALAPVLVKIGDLERRYADHAKTMEQHFQMMENRMKRIEGLIHRLSLFLAIFLLFRLLFAAVAS